MAKFEIVVEHMTGIYRPSYRWEAIIEEDGLNHRGRGDSLPDAIRNLARSIEESATGFYLREFCANLARKKEGPVTTALIDAGGGT